MHDAGVVTAHDAANLGQRHAGIVGDAHRQMAGCDDAGAAIIAHDGTDRDAGLRRHVADGAKDGSTARLGGDGAGFFDLRRGQSAASIPAMVLTAIGLRTPISAMMAAAASALTRSFGGSGAGAIAALT